MIRTFSILLLAAGAVALPAQTWTNATPAGPAPSTPRTSFGMAYDLTRGETVLYGGRASSLGDQETWTYNGVAWTQKMPANTPPALWGHVMVGAPGLGGVVLFGGRIGTTAQGDTWLWDGVDWRQIQTNNSPPPRAFHQMAFDARRGVVVLFGGSYIPPTPAYSSTWEFDGTDWTEVVTPTTPLVVGDGRMVFDGSRGVCVLFGGWNGSAARYGGVAEYDGVDWRIVTLPQQPAGRQWHHLSYDFQRARVVLHGGFGGGAANDTWEYDGQFWNLQNAVSVPTDAPDGQMVYDLGRDVHVYFGGRGPGGANSGTWEYRGSETSGSYAFAGTGCGGSAPALAAAAGGRPRAGNSFTMEATGLPSGAAGVLLTFGFRNTGLWPIDLTVLQMPGCYLQTDVVASYGMNVSGSVGTFTLTLPSSALGFSFWSQTVVLDPAANPQGVALSNAARGFIGT